MIAARSGCAARSVAVGTCLFEGGIQPQEIGREDAHGGVDNRRRIARVGGLPAVVRSRQGQFGRVLDPVARSHQVGGGPDVMPERFLVADAPGQPAQRIRIAAEHGSLLNKAQYEQLLVPGHPVSRHTGGQKLGEPNLPDAHPGRGGGTSHRG